MYTGKIAVATNDQTTVTGHIGKCRGFMIYEINDGKIISKELRDNLFTNHMMMQQEHHHGEAGGHSHVHLIEGLKDCKYLISRGGGWRVVEDLKKNDIKTIFADEELIEEAVDRFLKGELENDSDLICRRE